MTNKILALKYRPQEFKDLIGQEVMAKTITNAIKLGGGSSKVLSKPLKACLDSI